MAAERVTGGTLADSLPFLQDALRALAPGHPGPPQRLTHKDRCITCRDEAEPGSLVWSKCRPCRAAEGIAVLEETLRREIPPAFAWARFSAPELAKRVKSASAITEAMKPITSDGAVLTGPAGFGKTSLSVAMLANWINPDHLADRDAMFAARRLMFTTSFVLAKARSMARLGDEAGPVACALEASLLVIDDLGAEPEYKTSAIPEVIHERHQAGAPTIITTGFTPTDIATRYGDGIARRVFERATKIKCGPPPSSR